MQSRRFNLTVFAAAAIAAVSSHAADTVIGSAFGTRFQGGQYAYGASLALQHPWNQGGFVFGWNYSEFPIGSLSELDLDIYRTESARLSATAGVSVGEAIAGAQTNVLYKARFSIDSQFDPEWAIHAGYQYIDLNVIHGNLASASIEYRPVPHLGIKAGGGRDLTGTDAERYGNLEINWYGSTRLFGGVILGRTGYDPASLGDSSAVQRLFQFYACAAVPTKAGTLTIGVDSLSLERDSRQTIRLGFTSPIKQ